MNFTNIDLSKLSINSDLRDILKKIDDKVVLLSKSARYNMPNRINGVSISEPVTERSGILFYGRGTITNISSTGNVLNISCYDENNHITPFHVSKGVSLDIAFSFINWNSLSSVDPVMMINSQGSAPIKVNGLVVENVDECPFTENTHYHCVYDGQYWDFNTNHTIGYSGLWTPIIPSTYTTDTPVGKYYHWGNTIICYWYVPNIQNVSSDGYYVIDGFPDFCCEWNAAIVGIACSGQENSARSIVGPISIDDNDTIVRVPATVNTPSSGWVISYNSVYKA